MFVNVLGYCSPLTLQGLIVSLFSVGGFMGALGGGWLADYVGRKPTMILGASLVGISGLIHASAVTLW